MTATAFAENTAIASGEVGGMARAFIARCARLSEHVGRTIAVCGVTLLLLVAGAGVAGAAPRLTAPTPQPGSTATDSPVAVSVYATATVNIAGSQTFMLDGSPVFPVVLHRVVQEGYWADDPYEPWWVDPIYDFTQATVVWTGPLADGSHAVTATVGDSLGGTASTSWSFSVSAPPKITGSLPANNVAAPSLIPEVGVYVDENLGSVFGTITIDGVAAAGAWDGARALLSRVPGTPLADETWHEATATVSDFVGHTATTSWRFYVRSQVPLRVNSVSPAGGSTIVEMSPVISAQATDTEAISSAQMWVDGVLRPSTLTYAVASGHWEPVFEEDPYWVVDAWDYTSATASYSSYRLADGAHAAKVTFTDAIGLTTTQEWSFDVAMTPVAQNVWPADAGATAIARPLIWAEVLDNDAQPACTMTLDGAVVPATWLAGAKRYQYTPTTDLADHSTHTASVTLTDAAGHTSTRTWSFRVLLSPDTTYTPEPAAGSAVSVWNPTLSCVVSDTVPLSIGQVHLRLDGAFVPAAASWTPDFRQLTLSHKPAKLTDGPHTLNASAVNSIGQSTAQTWTINVAAPPILSALTPSNGSIAETLTPTLSASVAENSPGTLSFDVTIDGAPVASTYDDVAKKLTAPILARLSDDTSHTAAVRARDAAGNESVTTWTFKTERYAMMPVEQACTRCHTTLPAAHPMDRECYSCHAWIGIGHGSGSCGGGGDPMCHSDNAHSSASLNSIACTTCHRAANNNTHTLTNLPPHEDASLGAYCRRCHTSQLMREHQRRTTADGTPMTCSSCHASGESAVTGAIAAKDTTCIACHDPIEHHKPAAISGVKANGERLCTGCHSATLEVEHAKLTSKSAPGACEACHAEGGARDQLVGAWDGSCDTPACHGKSTDRPMHANYCMGCHSSDASADFAADVTADFDASSTVNRATACPKCHVASLAGTHPYHYKDANCGAFCHPGWGPSGITAIPSVATTYGAFASASSADVSAAELHRIHGRAMWPAGASRASSHCASCHAVAACGACHEDPDASAAHTAHGAVGSAECTPVAGWDGVVTSGVTGGDQTQLTEHPDTARCGSLRCHGAARSGEGAAVTRETYTHPALPSQGLPANTVTTTGSWSESLNRNYTAGRTRMSGTTSSSLSITFTGTHVALLGDVGPARGKFRVSIDGAQVAIVDEYAPTLRYQQTVFDSEQLEAGPHTITLTVLGQRTAPSTSNWITADQFRVWNSPPAAGVVPNCSNCHPSKAVAHP